MNALKFKTLRHNPARHPIYILFVLLCFQSGPVTAKTKTSKTTTKTSSTSTDTSSTSLEDRIVELEKKLTTPQVGLGDKGFFIKSSDGAHELRIRGMMQADARLFIDQPQNLGADQFVLRRARFYGEGEMFNQLFAFRVMPSIDFGTLTLMDAWVELRLLKELNIRVGKFKQPVGMERLQPIEESWFFELAYPTVLVPNRDIGIQISGDIGGGIFLYALGVFNGTIDGSNTEGDTNDAKDISGRVFVQPFVKSGIKALKGLGVGIAGTYGVQEGSTTNPSTAFFRTSGQARFFQYFNAPTAVPANITVATGKLWRVTPQATYFLGPLGLQAEFVKTSEGVINNANSQATLSHLAWQVAATAILTGEDLSYKGIQVKKPFSLKNHHWGALQIAARYHELRLDDDTFPNFASGTASARKAKSYGGSISWIPNNNMRISTNYEATLFTGGSTIGNRPTEHLIGTRVQFEY